MNVALLAALVVQDNPLVQHGGIGPISQAEWRQIYSAYGDCVVARYRKQATAAIIDNVDDETLMKRRRPLPAADCLKPPKMMSMRFGLQADRARYSIADSLVRSEFAEQPPSDLQAVLPLAHHSAGDPPPDMQRAPDSKESRAFRERLAFSQFSRFGECVVRSNPAAARDLLLTRPESKEETAAFGRLGPAMSNCLVSGETLAMTKLPLRGTIAVNYYRLARAAQDVSKGLAQ